MKISVITTSYNYGMYLEETIKSVLGQTFNDFEFIIIDDFSSDNSIEIINQFSDERIKLITHKTNQGLAYSIQEGIQNARGEWVAFLESDDIWDTQTLEKRVAEIERNPNISIIFNDVELFGEISKDFQEKIENIQKTVKLKPFPRCIFKGLNINNLIPTFSAVMIKKEAFNKVNFQAPSDALTDWWLYIQVAYGSLAHYIPEKLTKWRIHSDSYINNRAKKRVLTNICAYFEVFKTRIKNPIFLFFIAYTFILTVLKKLKILKNF